MSRHTYYLRTTWIQVLDPHPNTDEDSNSDPDDDEIVTITSSPTCFPSCDFVSTSSPSMMSDNGKYLNDDTNILGMNDNDDHYTYNDGSFFHDNEQSNGFLKNEVAIPIFVTVFILFLLCVFVYRKMDEVGYDDLVGYDDIVHYEDEVVDGGTSPPELLLHHHHNIQDDEKQDVLQGQMMKEIRQDTINSMFKKLEHTVVLKKSPVEETSRNLGLNNNNDNYCYDVESNEYNDKNYENSDNSIILLSRNTEATEKEDGDKYECNLTSTTENITPPTTMTSSITAVSTTAISSSSSSNSPLSLSDNNCCSICLDQFAHNDTIIALQNSCSHIFHKKCLLLWANTTTTNNNEVVGKCPMCREFMWDIDAYNYEFESELIKKITTMKERGIIAKRKLRIKEGGEEE